MLKSLVCFLPFVLFSIQLAQAYTSECYDRINGQPKKCSPEFINAAFRKKIIASNTCGTPKIEYCIQSSLHSSLYNSHENGYDHNTGRSNKKCDWCDSTRTNKAHPADHLTDYNSQSYVTWWQSETMNENIQYPNSVNLTLDLGKSFDITYIQIKFQSSKPESFAIYKRTNDQSDWIPYQYYSASCQSTYDLNTSQIIQRDREDQALCVDEFSDIAPLSGSSVAFSTLEGRPSAYIFDNSEVLKEWVTATEIKIVLNRLNTFGDEIFNDKQVLKSYYYAISDIAVGARCKCNGHASECLPSNDGRLKCVCQHNTDGDDCEKCAPSFNDIPWAPATNTHAHECKPCDCNGMSDVCFFDQTLYEQTGHGGHCLECQYNTDGINCERCLHGFYRLYNDKGCINCECDPVGSESLQCDPFGQCKCKPGVAGLKCNQCAANYYDLTMNGCKECACNVNGSADSPPVCNKVDGSCRCKINVEGRNCDRCKPGYFDLNSKHPEGCLQCFCFDRSCDCTSSSNHVITLIESKTTEQSDWKLQSSNPNLKLNPIKYSIQSDSVAIQYNPDFYRSESVWIHLPVEFLGNKRLSMNQELRFQLRLSSDDRVIASRKDIVLENSNENLEVYMPLTNGDMSQKLPTSAYQTYKFRLSANANWLPSIKIDKFHRLISNLTAIKIRVNYGFSDAFIHAVSLVSARLVDEIPESSEIATFVEQCKCPVGYTGQFCNLCDSGYKRAIPYDVYSNCVPCRCNNHSSGCDQYSGKCDCMHNTVGLQCEQCVVGYYGDATLGTPYDCKKCPCPNNGPCAEFSNYQSGINDVVCLDCPIGTF
jgi:laminin gamma 1